MKALFGLFVKKVHDTNNVKVNKFKDIEYV